MSPYKFKSNLNVKNIVLLISVFLLVCYGVFNARDIILGPSIEMFSPTRDTETSENILLVKGRVQNMAFLSLNERPIFVDMEGFFEEKLLLSPGSNIIEIRAKDRFKKEVLKRIKVYYKEATSTSVDTNASSTENLIPEN